MSYVLPFLNMNKRISKTFKIIHYNVWGPAPTLFSLVSKYYVTIIDSYSHYTLIYFMKTKFEVFKLFKQFHVLVHLVPILSIFNVMERVGTYALLNMKNTWEGKSHTTILRGCLFEGKEKRWGERMKRKGREGKSHPFSLPFPP